MDKTFDLEILFKIIYCYNYLYIYIALSSRLTALMSYVIQNVWLYPFTARFLIFIEMVYLHRKAGAT